MAFAPSSPVTGATVSGLTSPTYTISSDVAPSVNGKQYAVTALGGTQTGVDVNSVSKPFTHTFFRPLALRTLPQANPVTGLVKNVPINTYKLVSRKGMAPSAQMANSVGRVTTMIELPAGTDTFAPAEIRALLSAHIGILNAQASGIAETVITGVL